MYNLRGGTRPMRYVIVGGSVAGINCAKSIRQLDEKGEIILISKDKHIISRCRLHQYLSNEISVEELNFTNPVEFFETYNVKWKKGYEVTSIDTKAHSLTLMPYNFKPQTAQDEAENHGESETLTYDKLLLATGANSFIPPVENLRTANNVIGFRNLEDIDYIKDKLKTVKNVVVLGAGLIGMDAVSGLTHYDVKVSLIEMGKRILPIQLDEYSAQRYHDNFTKLGVDIKLGVAAQKVEVDENNNPTGLLLNTGEVVPCELIIVATGVRSNVEMIKKAGIECDFFGLIINAKGETNTRDVYGAGDVTGRNPIWPKARKEGIVAGNNMAGNEIYMTDYFAAKNTMYFSDLATLSLGTPIKPDDTYEEIVDIRGKDYRKMIFKDGRVYGVILQGDLSYAGVKTQFFKFNLHPGNIPRPLFEVDYGDYFCVRPNEEYSY